MSLDNLRNPAWWAAMAGYVVSILAGFGIVGGMPDAVRVALVTFGPIVGATFVHEHHATLRNQDTAAAAVATANAAVVTAAASRSPMPTTSSVTPPPSPQAPPFRP